MTQLFNKIFTNLLLKIIIKMNKILAGFQAKKENK